MLFFPLLFYLEKFCSPLKTWLRYHPVISALTHRPPDILIATCAKLLHNIYHMVKGLLYIFDSLTSSSLPISWEQRFLNLIIYSTFPTPQKRFITTLDSTHLGQRWTYGRLSINIYLTNKPNNLRIYCVITRYTDSLEKKDHRKSRR